MQPQFCVEIEAMILQGIIIDCLKIWITFVREKSIKKEHFQVNRQFEYGIITF